MRTFIENISENTADEGKKSTSKLKRNTEGKY